MSKGRSKTFEDGAKLEKEKKQQSVEVPINVQSQYPLLKPVTFTNTMEDDYIES